MKNRLLKFILFASCIIAAASYSQAAIKYGEGIVKEGNIVVVRSGRLFLYTEANNPVTIYENDTIRTLKNSSMTLLNPDQNRITLGANAIMQVKKWQKRGSTGMVRALFGKFRARTAAVRRSRSMNIRTATATIGIKGSLVEGVTNSTFTSTANLGGNISMDGVDIPLGQMAFRVDNPDFQIQTIDNPNFDPNQDEDSAETGNQQQLNTDNSKKVTAPPVIEQVIQEQVTEVTQAETKPDPKPEGSGRGTGDPLDDFQDEAEKGKEAASQTFPNANVKIKFED